MATKDIIDTMQLSVCHDEVKFFFVTKSGTADDASKDLMYSYEIVAEFSSSTEHLAWISEADCVLLRVSPLTKRDIFVLDKFEGEVFNHLSSSQAIVLGPRCVLSCQLTNDVVPNIASPIFTLAMRNVIACVSGISLVQRAQIHRLVGFMGGLWTNDLKESNTHLITNTTRSPKYEKAAIRDIKIMKEEWIYDVWKLSQTENNCYTSDDFVGKYKLPIFHKLVVTTTGISATAKSEIEKLISNNGGEYNGSFKSTSTDILISQPNQRDSEKFKAAVKCRKECLMVDWVKDSVSKGYALPYTNYRIYTGQVPTSLFNSTQISNKSITSAEFHSNVTQFSAIGHDFTIDEATMGKSIHSSKSIQSSVETKYVDSIANIDINEVKKCRGCIEGCIIWICGFNAKETNMIKKIINIGGATRHDAYDSSVNYVIVGKPRPSDLSMLKSLQNTNIVTINWLQACIDTNTTVDPKEFFYKPAICNSDAIPNAPSPASRKNIESMRSLRHPGIVPRRLKLDDENVNENEKNLLEHYTQPSTSQDKSRPDDDPAMDTRDESDCESINPNLFESRTFAIFGFSEESSEEIRLEIVEFGGLNVEDGDFSKAVDYLVVTCDTHSLDGVNYKAKEIVNDLWFQECLATNKLVDIEYYHRAILLTDNLRPLNNVKIVFSNYKSSERDYLNNLANALGGEVSERYMRKQNPILVCPTPEGQKFNGAIKWNLPVVSREWLRKCYELKRKVPLQPYLVGNTRCQDENFQNVSEKSVQQNSPNNESRISDENEKTEKNVKLNKSDGSKSINLSNESIENAENNIDEMLRTPAQHRRISLIKNTTSRQTSPILTQSPKTPVDSIAKFVEDIPTPITRSLVYDLLKSSEENESPLSKRRRLENVTDSPIDMSVLDPPDYFEMLDRKFIEVPKSRPSTPFVEYRKRMYIKVLGDKYDGSPLRHPYQDQVVEKRNETEVNRDEPTTSMSTQVQNLGNFIKKCREDRKSLVDAQMSLENKSFEDEPHTTNLPFSQGDANSENVEAPQVGWRDPDEFFQSERFGNPSRSIFKGTPCFSMSLMIEGYLQDQIIALKGKVCPDSREFDPQCTHLICYRPNQSEKTLAIIASGRWLLCPAYIEDSFKAGHFLNEENYEWGNPKAESKLPTDLDSKSENIAAVNFKWRKQLQLRSQQENKAVGIFSDFCVILHTPKADQFKRLIEAGCGVVVDVTSPFSNLEILKNVTHCFVDKRKIMLDADRSALKKAGVPCASVLYLQACLQNEHLPPLTEYLV